MYILDVCYMCVCKLNDNIIHREIEERLYVHYSQANYGLDSQKSKGLAKMMVLFSSGPLLMLPGWPSDRY